jgi:hypothetical protein
LPSDVAVRELHDADFEEWSRLMAHSPDGSIYSAPEYLAILCREAGGRFRILGVWHGDELAGGVALYEQESRFGTYVAHRLLLYYNGPVLRHYDTKYPSQQTARHLKTLSTLADALAERRYGCVTFRCRNTIADVRPFLAAGWSASPNYTYVVSVTDLDQAWSRVEQNLRRLVKRCEKEGMTLTEDEDFDSFYRLHALTMQRKELGYYLPEPAFRRYFEALRRCDLCRLFHARAGDGRAVATQLVLLGPGSVSHTVAAAADPEFLRSGVNAFLRWKTFEALSALGYQGNDLTNAGLDPVAHFKSQLGGDLRLCFVLQSPRTTAYRLGLTSERVYWSARSAAGRVARRLRLRP